MKKSLVALFTLIVVACSFSPVGAQDRDWKKELNRDLVTISDGTMNYSELQLCTIKNQSKAFQIQWNATAPQKGVVSRDNFVAIIVTVQAVFKTRIAQELKMSLDAYTKMVSCMPAESAIGKPELEITITMSDGGLQMQAKKAGSDAVNQTTTTWAQMFKDK